MKIQRNSPPQTIERGLKIEITKEEVLAILTKVMLDKLGSQLRIDDMAILGDDDGKLQGVNLSGVEIIPLNWKSDATAQGVSPVATVSPVTPVTTAAKLNK